MNLFQNNTTSDNPDDIIEMLMDFSGNSLREPTAKQTHFPLHLAKKDTQNRTTRPEITTDKILSRLSFTPISIDELIRACHVTISELQSTLLKLDLADLIKRLPANKIILLEQGDS